MATIAGGRDRLPLEQLRVAVRRAVQHGDLHGDDVLVYDVDKPVLIDYAEVGEVVAG